MPAKLRKYNAISYTYSKIDIREHRRDNKKWTVQRYWQHRTNKTKKNNTTCVGQGK